MPMMIRITSGPEFDETKCYQSWSGIPVNKSSPTQEQLRDLVSKTSMSIWNPVTSTSLTSAQ